MTSAPSDSRRARSSLACSRARVTTMRRPNNGACSNQPRSSAATSPTTMALGGSTPASAIVASVARIVRWFGRVPHRTAATGVCSSRPPAINALAISPTRAGTHQDHERSAAARQRIPVGVLGALRRIFVTGDDRDVRRQPAMRDRNAGVGGRRDRTRHSGHHLERDARPRRIPAPPHHRDRTRTDRRP